MDTNGFTLNLIVAYMRNRRYSYLQQGFSEITCKKMVLS
jgi:hypothetical protein